MAHFFQRNKGTGELMYMGERDTGGTQMWNEVSRDPIPFFGTVGDMSPLATVTGTSVTYTGITPDVYVADVDKFIEQRMGGQIAI